MPIFPRSSGKRYIPMLKTKEGELKSLYHLTTQQKNLITPLLELHSNDKIKDNTTLQQYCTKISQSWPGHQPLYFDGNSVAFFTNTNIGPSPSLTLFSQLIHAGLSIIPVTDPCRPIEYQTAISTIVQNQGNGICLRIPAILLNNRAQVISDIQTTLSSISVQTTATDILIDLGDIHPASPNAVSMHIPWLITEINALNAAAPWREIILAGSSFPQIIPGNPQTLSRIDRIEWIIWDNLRVSPQLQRVPNFSDYTCLPATPLPPAPYMAPAPKIRYTADTYWLVAKGQSVKQAPPTQYYRLSQIVSGLPEFCGPQFSFGDDYISQRASQAPPSTGYFTQWLTADVNHHIAYIIAQI
ncbi:beta family protein [Solidesulfovibrio carbinolicus]|uniref:Beta protein n=1 Tax=Solidesulfovibrio carbinolicus TaxID=296842 RepID=A0A4P6HH64_9BACT|nr:beta family protein [Solidesulfovibrio carbinolicus]QAZ66453.1 hypothetical protein C3Y92_04035 [Solidesulfovibrio carbinolicus]